jgi:hypothetical protein
VNTLNVLKKTWSGIALCAGLVVLPFPAHADASNEWRRRLSTQDFLLRLTRS